MPGIVGIVGSGSPEANACRLRRMMDCMLHEPVYTSSSYVNERLGVWIGWINRPESFTDCMPVWNETRDVCLVFSGENFADKSLINDLRARGHQFDPDNATYLVHLYEEMGLSFIEKLNGRFSGLLIDLRQQSVVIFNDRYGADRIYYHLNSEGFFFSSEAKSLLTVFRQLRNLDLTGLAETFSVGCVLQNRTLYRKVQLLPPASLWTFTGNRRFKKRTYFTPGRWEDQVALSGDEYYKSLKRTFATVIPRYFQGNNKIGMSLTGGLDGRIIMAWADVAPGSLPCYTFADSYRNSTDVQIARRVAQLCRQPHETIVVEPQFFMEFPSLAEKAIYISDGAMDVTGAVELYVNRIARRIAPVRLTGNYGSEIMRGTVAFRPGSPNKEILSSEFFELVRMAALTYGNESGGHPISFIAFKQVPWHHYSRLSLELSQVTMRSPYLDNDFVSLMYQAPPGLISSKKPALQLIADGNEKLASIPTDRGFLYRPVPLVTKCRQLYQEFTYKAEYAYDYGMPQWLARIDNIMNPLHLDRLFLGKHKFHHFRTWYRDRLAQYLKDTLLDSRTLSRPYLNGRRVEKIVCDHTSGKRNHTVEIHRVLTSELIQRTLIEQHA